MSIPPSAFRSKSLRSPILVALAFGAGLAAAAPAQSYRTCADEARGITWKIPSSFEEVPIPPTEKEIIARYARKRTKKERRKGAVVMNRAALLIVQLGRATGAARASGEEKRTVSSRPIEELAPGRMRAFLKRRAGKLHVQEKKRLRASSSIPLRILYEFLNEDPAKAGPRKHPVGLGNGCLYCDPEGIYLVIGTCSAQEYTLLKNLIAKVARSLRRSQPVDTSDHREKLVAEYRKLGYKQPAYRVEVEARLPEGWKAINTSNYIIIHHCRDRILLRLIENDMEGIRREYEKLFAPARPIEAVSTVRICRDRTEYLTYYGNPKSAGFWNSHTKELVLYGARKGEQNSRLGRLDTLIVLFHEAFHQYIYYAVGEIAPHIWYNEGSADYFSGAVFRSGKVVRIGVNPWRVNRIKRVVAESEGLAKPKYVPLEKLIRMSQAEYYRNGSQNYAQGWSFIHFLRQGRALAKHPRWKLILPTYFQVLKDEVAKGSEKLEGKGAELAQLKAKAMVSARATALKKAFEGIDFELLEKEWIRHVKSLPEFKMPH